MGWPRSLKKGPFLWLFLCQKSADFLLKLYTLWPLFDILESDSLAGAVGPQIAVPWSRIRRYFPFEMAKKTEVSCKKIPFVMYHFDHVFAPYFGLCGFYFKSEVARFWSKGSVSSQEHEHEFEKMARIFARFVPPGWRNLSRKEALR